MTDDRTQSTWEHIQGECIAGVWQGHLLETRTSLHYMTARQAAQQYPDARIAISRPSFRRTILDYLFLRPMRTEQGYLPFMFEWSMREADTRRDRLELGIGIWSGRGKCSRFYPLSVIRANNNVIVDTIGGQRVVIYVDPNTQTPEAIYTQAQSATWVEDALTLDTGEAIRNGRLYCGEEAIMRKRPNQLFTRWYGFSSTFPSCTIYE